MLKGRQSFSQDELAKSITRPKKVDNTKNPKVETVVHYNSKGQNDLKLKKQFNEDSSVAISIPATNGVTYKVRAKRGGQLYNPFEDGSLEQRDRTTNEIRFRFKTVSENAFNHYITFLKSNNQSSYIKAQREI